MKEIVVIGGGLAGVEAAWQAARLGADVRLYEMRPVKQTPAHRTDKLAEIVCSNSLKSDEPGSAPYLLKEELRRAGSLVMEAAAATRVPAGAALAVDRHTFAELITERIENEPRIEIVREEVTRIPETDITVIATGPLSSEALTFEIMKLTGNDQLYFYDAIAPIVAADSIDTSVAFRAARYDKGGDDYLNCPFDKEQYATFYSALIEANSVPLQRFEETHWFEACLPIEELARRGVDTLQFGQIHRNTYICSPRVLDPTMQMRGRSNIFFAGQITGVEGYIESVAMGWIAGVNAARLALGRKLIEAPPLSATGALARYVSQAKTKNFQPVNITFALLQPLAEHDQRRLRKKRDRRQLQVELALKEWEVWLQENQHQNEAVQVTAT